MDECSGQGQLAIGFYAAKALFICLPYFSEDAQRLLSHAAQVATACASTLRAEFAAVDRPGLTALQQLVGVAWSGLAFVMHDGFWEFLACISMRMATLGCNVVLCQNIQQQSVFCYVKLWHWYWTCEARGKNLEKTLSGPRLRQC